VPAKELPPFTREQAVERFATLCKAALEEGDARSARACLVEISRLHASGLRIEVALRLLPTPPVDPLG
jgi:hypothetical protein